jgi:hypothetical protein
MFAYRIMEVTHMEITKDLASRVLEIVDKGLAFGMGKQVSGEMCVEAAVCYALGLPHGDNPPCVGDAVREFKIRLNDASWSSKAARAKGLRRVAVAQLGSDTIDQGAFARIVALETVRQVLPKALRVVGLEMEAQRCTGVENLKDANAAANAATANANATAYAAATANANATAYAAATAAAYAAHAAAYAAANAAAYAADAAATAAAYAAHAAAYAAANAAHAAVYAITPTTANAILSLSAEIAVTALIDCKSPGASLLYLCPLM